MKRKFILLSLLVLTLFSSCYTTPRYIPGTIAVIPNVVPVTEIGIDTNGNKIVYVRGTNVPLAYASNVVATTGTILY